MNEESKNESLDLTVFDDLLQSNISEDTKALIIAQRELYKQNEVLRETLYERTTQIVIGTDWILRYFEKNVPVSHENDLKLIEAVNNISKEENNNIDYTNILKNLESSSNKTNATLEVLGENTSVIAESVPLSTYADSYLIGGIMLFFAVLALYFICKPVLFIMRNIV